MCTRPSAWVLEIDIRSYFDAMVRSALVGMIEKRVIDGSVLRLIGKWINVGVIEDGRLLVRETGTGQGQPISPLLANLYLHSVFDEWFEREVKPRLRGEAYEIRFADDAILCFQHKEDAEKVLEVLPKAVREIRFDPTPGEDAADGVRAICSRECKEAGKETGNLQLLGLRTHRRPQPTGEVHRAREDNSQATGSRAEGHRAVVQNSTVTIL